MPSGPRLLLENVCYHIVSRGNQKRKVFIEDEDFEYYLMKLRKYKRRYDFSLYGYCLMPNHPHLQGEIKEAKNLSCFMHDLIRSYTAYFNKKYEKVGYLWQGRFKSYVITKDQYVINCINYIEHNPVRAGIVTTASEYKYSSYRERALGILDRAPMLNNLSI